MSGYDPYDLSAPRGKRHECVPTDNVAQIITLKDAEIARLRERVEKLEAECEFVKAQKESLQRTAEFAVSLAEEFERAVASREPVSGMQVTPTGDFISAAQLPSVLKRMKWWAREIRKADAARAALGEVEREG